MKFVEEKLLKIVNTYSINEIQNYSYSIDLVNDLGFDSITLIKIVIEIEKEFGFFFEDEKLDFSELTKLSKLLEYIEGEMEKKERGK